MIRRETLQHLTAGGAAGAAAAAIVLTMIGDHAVTVSRPTLEAAIEVLIEVLDDLDGDADIEPDVGEEREEGDEDFEPSLGWSRTMAVGRYDSAPLTLDLEDWYSEVAA